MFLLISWKLQKEKKKKKKNIVSNENHVTGNRATSPVQFARNPRNSHLPVSCDTCVPEQPAPLWIYDVRYTRVPQRSYLYAWWKSWSTDTTKHLSLNVTGRGNKWRVGYESKDLEPQGCKDPFWSLVPAYGSILSNFFQTVYRLPSLRRTRCARVFYHIYDTIRKRCCRNFLCSVSVSLYDKKTRS